MIVDSNTC